MAKTPNPIGFYSSLISQIKTNKRAFTVYVILRIIVLAVIIRSALQGRVESMFTGILVLILFLIPPFLEKQFKIELPTMLETLAFIFIFCAEILGEIEGYYVKFPFWDTMLHTVNGFMFAAFGFCLVDIFNRNPRFKFRLSPVFLAITAFCFSMTIGILWEFLEFSVDFLFLTDMQKDFIIESFGTVKLTGSNQLIDDISQTVITTASGKTYTVNEGYLDIGLYDTMKDLFVNFIGAVLFSIVGFFYIKQRGKGVLASQFIPVFKTEENKQKNTEKNEEASKELPDNELKEGSGDNKETAAEQNDSKLDQNE